MPALMKAGSGFLAACFLVLALSVCATSSAQAQAEIDAALTLYRLRIFQSGSRLRAYPDEALKQGLEGTAAIELIIAADGTLKSAKLLRSSGHALLDRHALELLARAVPLTEIPSSLQNRAFAVNVAIAFKLPQ